MELFDRLKNGLAKTSRQIGAAFASFAGIDDDFYDSLEETLILADVGAALSALIVENLRETVIAEGLRGADEIRAALAAILESKLAVSGGGVSGGFASPDGSGLSDGGLPGNAPQEDAYPLVTLVIGVNGVGKTTTIGKLAARYAAQGKSVLLCAGDTFRAAAGEQLSLWAKRAGCEIIRRDEGADPGSVVFDAMAAAKSRSSDVVICDTAGRLHNKSNLMNELSKISRIIDREMPQASKEMLLVLDAGTGQNGLIQARQFVECAGVTGIVLTKLDGTAKGGIVYAIAGELEIPVKYIGVGEKPEDLLDFNAADFTKCIVGSIRN